MERPTKRARVQDDRPIVARQASVAIPDAGLIGVATMPPVDRTHAFARRKIRPA